MKPLNYSALICSLIIGISIVTASFILQRTEGVKSVPAVTDEAYSMQTDSPLMTLEQTAEFLNLTESQVKSIISSENALRAQGDSEEVSFPYIVVQNEIYVSQIGLMSWLDGAARDRRVY
ncbi:hypothetical protein DP091_07650 [Paenibacillus sp. MDMC362]|nr:hypothetical protein DP091_07650 [Paenibacillus sp. MDMC362]